MPPLSPDNDDVQRREFLLEFDPREPAPARGVEAGGVFDDEPLIAPGARRLERLLDAVGGRRLANVHAAQRGVGEFERVEQAAALGEWLGKERAAF